MCNCTNTCNASCSVCSSAAVVYTAPPLSGAGTAISPLTVANGTVINQVLQWNGTAWVAAAVAGVSPQTLSLVTRTLSISGGNSVTLPNDIQVLSFAAPTISLSQAGGSLSIASFISADSPNLVSLGTDSKLKAALTVSFPLTGNGTSGSPLTMSSSGVSSGQYLSWNGSAWVATTPLVSSVNSQTGSVDLTLDDISGVSVGGATSSQLLRFDGSNWVNWTPNFSVITNASTVGAMLYWNGTAYTPTTPRKDVQTLTSGTTLTLPQTPLTGTIVDFYLNGLLKTEGVDYTRVGAVITYGTAFTAGNVQTTRYYS